MQRRKETVIIMNAYRRMNDNVQSMVSAHFKTMISNNEQVKKDWRVEKQWQDSTLLRTGKDVSNEKQNDMSDERFGAGLPTRILRSYCKVHGSNSESVTDGIIQSFFSMFEAGIGSLL